MTTAELTLAVSDPAPDATLTSAEGAEVPLSSLWPEGPLVLIFLRPLGSQYSIDSALKWRDADDIVRKASGEIAAVCTGTPAEAASLRQQWNLPYPVLSDPSGQAYTAFGVTSEQPGSFVVDIEGVVRYAYRSAGAGDRPPTWELVDAVCTLTGASVEKPSQTPLQPKPSAAAPAAPAQGNGVTTSYRCAKCDYTDYEINEISTASGMLSRLFNFQHRRFSGVTCRQCKYTEFYKMDSGALRNVLDLMVGS
jgi:predicted nucleic-acid-binding Zn-ribbon protein/peroxiredoxin